MHDNELTVVLPDNERIKPMRPDDLDAVCLLESATQSDPWTRQHFIDEMNNPVASVDLYWSGDQVAGFVCTWLIAGEMQLQNIATLPAMRRRGIAARLLQHVICCGMRQSLHSVQLEVRASNEPAIAMYRRFGFTVTGMRQRYYPDGEDALLMTLETGAGG